MSKNPERKRRNLRTKKRSKPTHDAKVPGVETSKERNLPSSSAIWNPGTVNSLGDDLHSERIAKNLLLERLPREVLNRLKSKLIPVTLKHSEIVHKPGEKIVDLYFPTTCMISVTIAMHDGRTVEAGAIGSREVVGINAFMGGREITQAEYIVQIPGDAIKINADPLRAEFNRNTEMRDMLLRYTQAFVAQISQNVACNRLHETQQRFARWILEVRDRVQADEFPLTHEFMAQMLGIRRASVTDASVRLKKEQIIATRRGSFKILNLEALLKMSCECYFSLREEYDRLLNTSS